MVDSTTPQNDQPIQSQSELINQLQNIATRLAGGVQAITNATPIPTTTTSPKFTAVSLSTATSSIIATSSIRRGMLFHNVGLTAIVYIYGSAMSPAPSSSSIGGTIGIYPGGTFTLPSAQFPNLNAGFSAFTNTGSSQPFTIVEFF